MWHDQQGAASFERFFTKTQKWAYHGAQIKREVLFINGMCIYVKKFRAISVARVHSIETQESRLAFITQLGIHRVKFIRGSSNARESRIHSLMLVKFLTLHKYSTDSSSIPAAVKILPSK